MNDLGVRIRQHWADRGNIELFQALAQRRGVEPSDLSAEDMAGLDQLHAGQLGATRQFISWAEVEEGDIVLDVGAGLGGTARYMARTLSCEVMALDLVPELVECGRILTQWQGLDELVEHFQGDIQDIEEDGRFDVVLLQHVDMHVPNKVEMYKACRAALSPEDTSRVVWHDWLAGPGGDLIFPVPWAHDGEEISFLTSLDQFRENLVAAGLAVHRFQPLPAETSIWFNDSREQIIRVLDKVSGSARRRMESILEEVDGVLANLAELRVLPFFAEARRVE